MNHYELAILNLRRAEESVEVHDIEAYLRLALIHAVLAIAMESGAMTAEAGHLRREIALRA